MSRLNDAIDDPDTADGPKFDWEPLISFLRELLAHFRLLFIIMIVVVAGVLGKYMTLQPQYMAVAVIGPPGPSPVDSLMPSADVGNTASSVARRVLGGGGNSSSNDTYQEYLQLLHSVRLAKVLIEKDHLLQVLYAGIWDQENQRWRPPSTVHTAIAGVKRFFHRPSKDAPDVDSLIAFLNLNLTVTRVGPDSGVAKLLSSPSPYSTVSFVYDDPKSAEAILNMILQEADDIIRQERRRDVNARLAFLNAEMPKVTVSDQREALIAIMSGQEQLSMMIEADKRYASTLVDPPHALGIPSSPTGPSFFIMVAMAFSVVIWIGLIYLATRFEIVRTNVRRVERVISFGRVS